MISRMVIKGGSMVQNVLCLGIFVVTFKILILHAGHSCNILNISQSMYVFSDAFVLVFVCLWFLFKLNTTLKKKKKKKNERDPCCVLADKNKR